MKSSDVWYITTFYNYAWLAFLIFAEVLLFKRERITENFVVTTKVLRVLVLLLSLQAYLIKLKMEDYLVYLLITNWALSFSFVIGALSLD